MNAMGAIDAALTEKEARLEAHAWMGAVLDHFARAEQALGELSLALDLQVTNGSLSSLQTICDRLKRSENPKFHAFERRIERWRKNRAYRHLLAHARLTTLFDHEGRKFVITRHLPRDAADVTPDRLWSFEERIELLRQATNDGRSICDQVRNIKADTAILRALRKA